jgi:hypothetical protein
MLVSPIGNYILKFGNGINDENGMDGMGLISLFIVTIFITHLVGFVGGAVTHSAKDEDLSVVKGRGHDLRHNKMLLLTSFFIVLAGAALYHWSDDAVKIGIGIATALLPPLVASGFALGKVIKGKHNETHIRIADVGYSLLLFTINFITLCVGSIIFNAIKNSKGTVLPKIDVGSRGL